MRKTEELSLDDATAAVAEIVAVSGSVPEKLAEAILSAARAYRRLHKKLPAGVSAATDRKF